MISRLKEKFSLQISDDYMFGNGIATSNISWLLNHNPDVYSIVHGLQTVSWRILLFAVQVAMLKRSVQKRIWPCETNFYWCPDGFTHVLVTLFSDKTSD